LKGGTASDGSISAFAWRQTITDDEPDKKAEYFQNTQQECKLSVILNSLN